MSKIAKKIAEYLDTHVPFDELCNILVDIDTEKGRITLAKIIDEVLDGKIISKSEVDALRRDSDAFVFTGSLLHATWHGAAKNYDELVAARAEIEKLRRELYLKECAYQSVKAELNGAKSRLFIVTPCDICGKLDPPNAAHGHSEFQKFVRRLKFWR